MNAHTLSIGRVDGENVIITQSWLNQLPGLFVFVCLVAIASYLTIERPDFTTLPVGSFELPILMLFPLYALGRVAYRVCDERLVATPNYLIYVSGRLSWRERSVRLEYPHIQEIEIVESILQRILGLGDLVITPFGGRDAATISMSGLRNPRAVKDFCRAKKASGDSLVPPFIESSASS